jgi:hypothetical protein
MNNEQMKSALRSLIIACSGLIAGWFASKGWFTTEQVTAVLSSPVFLSLATAAAGGIWGLTTHTEANAVVVVSDIAKRPDSPVKGIITEPTYEGRQLAASIPGPTVAPAGTADAQKLAEPQHTGL